MNRVESAIAEGRCLLVFGQRALQDAETLGELRRRAAIPAAVLGGDAPSPAQHIAPTLVDAVTGRDGGVIVLVEADSVDGAGLGTLAGLVQGGKHKPRLVVAARAFNPFSLPPGLRTLKFEHEKKKAKEFLFSLPVPSAAVAVAAAPVVEAPKKPGAPRAIFVGREEELATLAEWTRGPQVIVGPPGIGRRWLVEKAVAGAARIPDARLGWGAEADMLYARIAEAATAAGDPALGQALRSPANRPAPDALADLAVAALQKVEGVLVIDRLEHALRRDGTFLREGRLEILLRALLLGDYPARVVFISTIRPRFYREGEGANLRVLEIGGLRGNQLHEIFDAARVEEFPREHFGEIHARIHGHPLAARWFAAAVNAAEDREVILENSKFMRMHEAGDLDALARGAQAVVKALAKSDRAALAALAHFRLPFTAQDGEGLGIPREVRLRLLAVGALESLPPEAPMRAFYVHALVKRALEDREVSDFGVLEQLGDHFIEEARKGKGATKLAYAQEGNRLLFEAHRVKNREGMPYPDHDPALHSLRGMIRTKKQRLDLAHQRIAEVLKLDPANTEVQLMRVELLVAAHAGHEAIDEALAEAESRAPTPEVFHVAASALAERRGGPTMAVAALERGCARFPANARLRRRLAGFLVAADRFGEAAAVAKEAMSLEPMMPDTYGLLGEIYLSMGPERFADAEQTLSEARRLDPDNTIHAARLGALLFKTAGTDPERRAQAKELLGATVAADPRNYAAHYFLANLLIETGDDLDRADWLLQKAHELDPRSTAPIVERARVCARREQWADAEQLLDRALRMDLVCHEAMHARAEMYLAQGHVFSAAPLLEKAISVTPPSAEGAKKRYQELLDHCIQLITSGQAVAMAKAAEERGLGAPADRPVERPAGERREPGKTSKRRRRAGANKTEGGPPDGESAVAAEVAAEASADAPATDEADAAGIASGVPPAGKSGA
jgi:tetratricopeptide (TPR) repeat protein